MIIKSCDLKNFRNHEKLSINFHSGINFIIGNNGTGKTNILESISVVSNLKSFREASDEDMVNWNGDYYRICCRVVDEAEKKFEVGFSFINGKRRKLLKIDDSHIHKAIDFYGNILCVYFTPLDSYIISGNVSLKRRYVDSVISKTDKKYLELIYKCRKMFIERNILLKKRKNGKINGDFLKNIEVWTDMISEVTVYIVDKRNSFIDEYNKDLFLSYNNISGKNDGPRIMYNSDFTGRKKEDIFEYIMSNVSNDIKYGFSTRGIHKDIYSILNKDDRVFKDVSSQGEIRSAAIALKISEKKFIERERNNKAIIMVDDIFSELDILRKRNMINLFHNGNQVIMTMANFNKNDFDEISNIKITEMKN